MTRLNPNRIMYQCKKCGSPLCWDDDEEKWIMWGPSECDCDPYREDDDA